MVRETESICRSKVNGQKSVTLKQDVWHLRHARVAGVRDAVM
jgi:hypothetical protein